MPASARRGIHDKVPGFHRQGIENLRQQDGGMTMFWFIFV
jgi:hypothetical protein